MKKRLVITSFVMFCMVLLAACGGTSGAATRSGGTGVASSTPGGNARAVIVTLTDTKIVSSKVTFSANTPYDFTITNMGHSPHDFIIRKRPEGPPVGQQNDQGVLYIVGGNTLLPGKTVHFSYGFPQVAANSTVQFEEHLAGKSQPAGPIVPIQVTRAI